MQVFVGSFIKQTTEFRSSLRGSSQLLLMNSSCWAGRHRPRRAEPAGEQRHLGPVLRAPGRLLLPPARLRVAGWGRHPPHQAVDRRPEALLRGQRQLRLAVADAGEGAGRPRGGLPADGGGHGQDLAGLLDARGEGKEGSGQVRPPLLSLWLTGVYQVDGASFFFPAMCQVSSLPVHRHRSLLPTAREEHGQGGPGANLHFPLFVSTSVRHPREVRAWTL